MPSPPAAPAAAPRLRSARVLRVAENACDVWGEGGHVSSVRFAPTMPAPRLERVSPGHLVAIATSANGAEVVVWRWYDAVVLAPVDAGSVRLWEPAHGEVIARPGPSYDDVEPGHRAYASAGLPGADWWVACAVATPSKSAHVELDQVQALYDENDLWPTAFMSGP